MQSDWKHPGTEDIFGVFMHYSSYLYLKHTGHYWTP